MTNAPEGEKIERKHSPLPTADQCNYMTCSCTDGCKRVNAKLNIHYELVEALERLLKIAPAFRTKNVGGVGSYARQEQNEHIAAENQARAILAKAKEVV